MALTYTWELIGLKKQHTDDLDNVIIGTQWKVTGIDEDGFKGVFNGATPFDLNAVNTGSFTPYSELTEQQVMGWIKEIVSGSGPSNYMNHINQMIYRQINHVKYSQRDVEADDFPWSPISGSKPQVTAEPAPYQ